MSENQRSSDFAKPLRAAISVYQWFLSEPTGSDPPTHCAALSAGFPFGSARPVGPAHRRHHPDDETGASPLEGGTQHETQNQAEQPHVGRFQVTQQKAKCLILHCGRQCTGDRRNRRLQARGVSPSSASDSPFWDARKCAKSGLADGRALSARFQTSNFRFQKVEPAVPANWLGFVRSRGAFRASLLTEQVPPRSGFGRIGHKGRP